MQEANNRRQTVRQRQQTSKQVETADDVNDRRKAGRVKHHSFRPHMAANKIR